MSLICLQGGNEFTRGCRDMDAYLLERAGGDGVVVLPLASAPGTEYATAGRNGAEYFAALGAKDVVVAPDARDDFLGAVRAIDQASLLVLPGGSPRRLREAVTGIPPVLSSIRNVAAGRVVMGASAGAMLLCEWTVLPETSVELAEGFGIVEYFAVVPHFEGSKPDWEKALLPYVDVLGIPECSGVLIHEETVTAVGRRATTLVGRDVRETLALVDLRDR